MYKRFITTLNYLGLSFKREIIILTTINLLLIGVLVLLIYFKVTNFMIFMYSILIPFINYFYLSRYKDLVRKMEEKHNTEFISLLSYFEIFISNHNNVYRSFEMLIPYSSDWMNERLEKMLQEIDLDKSVNPYVRFAKNFSYLVIENVMISIYQMTEQGENDYSLMQFDHIFSSLNDALMTNKIAVHEKNIDTLNAFPLIGAGLITLTLTLSIISILGDLTNVI